MNLIIEIFKTCGLPEFEAIALFKLLFATICGGLVGLEREMKGRPAGLKTFSLVCVGSTLAMVTNEFIYINLAHSSGDSARMAAQVISGIGFLGAGTIMVTGHNQVRGLTTAAALWVTAALGIAIGSGFYFGGIAGLGIIYVSSFIYRFLDNKIVAQSRIMRISVEGVNEEFMLELIKYFEITNIRVLGFQRKSENKWYKKDTCAMIEMDLGRKKKHQLVLDDIRKLDGLRYAEEF
ncbi:MAG: MgtC/SapB family protein [Hungatella sp.]